MSWFLYNLKLNFSIAENLSFAEQSTGAPINISPEVDAVDIPRGIDIKKPTPGNYNTKTHGKEIRHSIVLRLL